MRILVWILRDCGERLTPFRKKEKTIPEYFEPGFFGQKIWRALICAVTILSFAKEKCCILSYCRNTLVKKNQTWYQEIYAFFTWKESVKQCGFSWHWCRLVTITVWSFFSFWHLPRGLLSPWRACHPTHSAADMPGGCSHPCWQQLCFPGDGWLCGPSPAIVPCLWPCFSDSYLGGHPLPAGKVSSCQCCTFSLGASPGWVGGRITGIPSSLSETKLCCLPGPVRHWLLSPGEGRQFLSQTLCHLGRVEALV